MFGGLQQPAFINTIVNLTGIGYLKDLSGGVANGVGMTPFVRTITSQQSMTHLHYVVNGLA
jgi:hypothetical protein